MRLGADALEVGQGRGDLFGDALEAQLDLLKSLGQEQGPLRELTQPEAGERSHAVVVCGDAERGAGRQQLTLGKIAESSSQLVRGGDQ